MQKTPLAEEGEFRSILKSNAVRTATAADAVRGVQPQLVLEPASEAELAAALRLASDTALAVIPRGGGTKLAWGNPPARADAILSTARMNRIVEHVWADLTVTVEAGCTVQELQAALAQHGQRLAIDPLWPGRATIGGILSTNDSGALRLRFGALRDLIIGVTIALPDGTLASSGGKVVKNVAGYDLPKLVIGAFGTLGVITRAVFRLHPIPRHTETLTVAASSREAAQRLALAVQDSQLAHTALQLRASHNSGALVDVLLESTEEGIRAQEAQFRRLAGNASVAESAETVWKAAQGLWESADAAGIAKITSLPADIAKTAGAVQRIAAGGKLAWTLVMQAIGVGALRIEGPANALHAALPELRNQLERDGASLVIQHWPSSLPQLDAWGKAGDALSLMRAVKQQFDPKNTLNPGRFAGGI